MDLKKTAHHELKIMPEHFKNVKSGLKMFELRKNDRDFKVGDTVLLVEWKDHQFTGMYFDLQIKYILPGGQCGLSKRYCIFGW